MLAEPKRSFSMLEQVLTLCLDFASQKVTKLVKPVKGLFETYTKPNKDGGARSMQFECAKKNIYRRIHESIQVVPRSMDRKDNELIGPQPCRVLLHSQLQ